MAVITISRQSGSEGNEITRHLCERLGYNYFDKKMMTQLAQELGLAPDQVVDLSADQYQVKSWLERAFGDFQIPFGDPGTWVLSAQQDAQEALSIEFVRKMICSAYEHGNVIIIGRGGQVVLAGKPKVLHVRIIAPLETRIKRWQAREGYVYEDARKIVLKRDHAHIDFVRRYFNADLADPSLYDLVINTEKFTTTQAVELIARALDLMGA